MSDSQSPKYLLHICSETPWLNVNRTGCEFWKKCFEASVNSVHDDELLEKVFQKSGYHFAKSLREASTRGTDLPTPSCITIMMEELFEKIKPRNNPNTMILTALAKDLLQLVIAARYYLILQNGNNDWTDRYYYKLIKELHFYLD